MATLQPIAIEFEHWEIHHGHSFMLDAADLDMGDGDELIIAFKTPSTVYVPHLSSVFASGAGGHLEILEGATWTNQTGTQKAVYNRNRIESIVTKVLEDTAAATFSATGYAILNPTLTSDGTVIYTRYSFGEKKITTFFRAENEIVFNKNTNYAIRYTADGGQNKGELILNWYESPDW